MTMDVGQLLIAQTDSHERGECIMELPEGESRITKGVKGFFEKDIELSEPGKEAWALHSCAEGYVLGKKPDRHLTEGSVSVCSDSLPGSLDGMSLLYFTNLVCS